MESITNLPYGVAQVFRLHENGPTEPLEDGHCGNTFKTVTDDHESVVVQGRSLELDGLSSTSRCVGVIKLLEGGDLMTPELYESVSGAELESGLIIDGVAWMATRFMGDGEMPEVTPELARQSGEWIRQFQNAMSGPSLIDLAKIRTSGEVMSDLERHFADVSEEYQLTAQAILELHRENFTETDYLYTDQIGRLCVTHGDPRLANMLYEGGDPIAMIDFEEVCEATEIRDIGSSIRSVVKEMTMNGADESAIEEAGIAVVKGFYGTENPTADQIRNSLLAAVQVGTELAGRYVLDAKRQKEFRAKPGQTAEDLMAQNYTKAKVQHKANALVLDML